MLTFSSFLGAGVTIATSAGVQAVFHRYGKSDFADTLHSLTHAGALSYAAYFVVKLLQVSVQAFL